MTIKPIASSQKQNDKKENHDRHSGVSVGVVEQQNQQNVRSSQHRNVIDGHGQSPNRRGDVYDDIARHRRSPHKSNSRSKRIEQHNHHNHHHHHNKRERADREKITVSSTSQYHHPVVVPSSKCNSPHVHSGGKSPEHLSTLPAVLGAGSPTVSAVNQAAANLIKAVEDTYSGYNSGDEHLQPKENFISVDEWQRRDEQFAKCMADRGFVLKPIEEDGACLFRAISLQIYGDEDMHDVIRQHTMDYIYKNREYFSHFVTEDINSYIKRKRRKDSHGNHIEIQAMSEIYNRPVELYCYKPAPINIFNSEQKNNGFAPLRLSYQRGSHYNAILDPYNATVGVGLGLSGYKPELQTLEAARLSEQLEIEQTMFEDKLKTTDWEATNEAIEEQIARESYLQWCRDNIQKSRTSASCSSSTAIASTSGPSSSSSTVTSADASACPGSPSKYFSFSQNQFSSTVTANIVNGPSSSFNSATKDIAEHPYDQTGAESDDTDMSSTSSIGNNSGGSSPASRAKKSKNSANCTRGIKKRRREAAAAAAAAVGMGGNVSNRDGCAKSFNNNNNNNNELTPPAEDFCKNPKCDTSSETVTITTNTAKCADSPKSSTKRELVMNSQSTSSTIANETQTSQSVKSSEQLPSTSKQSENILKDEESVSTQPLSIFYQSLLESSYAADGFEQLTESEMLQRAIQLSTQDYIEDQKRKIMYRS